MGVKSDSLHLDIDWQLKEGNVDKLKDGVNQAVDGISEKIAEEVQQGLSSKKVLKNAQKIGKTIQQKATETPKTKKTRKSAKSAAQEYSEKDPIEALKETGSTFSKRIAKRSFNGLTTIGKQVQGLGKSGDALVGSLASAGLMAQGVTQAFRDISELSEQQRVKVQQVVEMITNLNNGLGNGKNNYFTSTTKAINEMFKAYRRYQSAVSSGNQSKAATEAKNLTRWANAYQGVYKGSKIASTNSELLSGFGGSKDAIKEVAAIIKDVRGGESKFGSVSKDYSMKQFRTTSENIQDAMNKFGMNVRMLISSDYYDFIKPREEKASSGKSTPAQPETAKPVKDTRPKGQAVNFNKDPNSRWQSKVPMKAMQHRVDQIQGMLDQIWDIYLKEGGTIDEAAQKALKGKDIGNQDPLYYTYDKFQEYLRLTGGRNGNKGRYIDPFGQRGFRSIGLSEDDKRSISRSWQLGGRVSSNTYAKELMTDWEKFLNTSGARNVTLPETTWNNQSGKYQIPVQLKQSEAVVREEIGKYEAWLDSLIKGAQQSKMSLEQYVQQQIADKKFSQLELDSTYGLFLGLTSNTGKERYKADNGEYVFDRITNQENRDKAKRHVTTKKYQRAINQEYNIRHNASLERQIERGEHIVKLKTSNLSHEKEEEEIARLSRDELRRIAQSLPEGTTAKEKRRNQLEQKLQTLFEAAKTSNQKGNTFSVSGGYGSGKDQHIRSDYYEWLALGGDSSKFSYGGVNPFQAQYFNALVNGGTTEEVKKRWAKALGTAEEYADWRQSYQEGLKYDYTLRAKKAGLPIDNLFADEKKETTPPPTLSKELKEKRRDALETYLKNSIATMTADDKQVLDKYSEFNALGGKTTKLLDQNGKNPFKEVFSTDEIAKSYQKWRDQVKTPDYISSIQAEVQALQRQNAALDENTGKKKENAEAGAEAGKEQKKNTEEIPEEKTQRKTDETSSEGDASEERAEHLRQETAEQQRLNAARAEGAETASGSQTVEQANAATEALQRQRQAQQEVNASQAQAPVKSSKQALKELQSLKDSRSNIMRSWAELDYARQRASVESGHVSPTSDELLEQYSERANVLKSFMEQLSRIESLAPEDYESTKNNLEQELSKIEGSISAIKGRGNEKSFRDSMKQIPIPDDIDTTEYVNKINTLAEGIRNGTIEIEKAKEEMYQMLRFDPNTIIDSEQEIGQAAQEMGQQISNAAEQATGKIVKMYRAFNSQHGVAGKEMSWFTDDLETAGTYFKNATFSGGRKDKLAQLETNVRKFMSIDAHGSHWGEISYDGNVYTANELAELAKQAGYIGLEIKNVYDSVNGEASKLMSNVYTIFDDNVVSKAKDQTKELENELKNFDTINQHINESLNMFSDRPKGVFEGAESSFQEIVDLYKSGSITIEQALSSIDETRERILSKDNIRNDFTNKVTDLWKSLKSQSQFSDDIYMGFGKNNVWESTLQGFLAGTIDEQKALQDIQAEFRKVLKLSDVVSTSSSTASLSSQIEEVTSSEQEIGQAAAQAGEKAAEAGRKVRQAGEEAAQGARQVQQATNQAQGSIGGLNDAISNTNDLGGNMHFITDEFGKIVTFYRGLQDSMGQGLVSSRFNGATFWTDSFDLAKEYSRWSKVESANLSMIRPLEINGKGSSWNNIEYLGTGSDEASQKIIEAKRILNDAVETYYDWAVMEGYNIKDITSKHGIFNFQRFYDEILKPQNDNIPKEFADQHVETYNNAMSAWKTYQQISDDPSNVYGRHNTKEFVKLAQDSGNYDGVIFKNIVDSASGVVTEATNVVVQFNQNQMKFLETISASSNLNERDVAAIAQNYAGVLNSLSEAENEFQQYQRAHRRGMLSKGAYEQAGEQVESLREKAGYYTKILPILSKYNDQLLEIKNAEIDRSQVQPNEKYMNGVKKYLEQNLVDLYDNKDSIGLDFDIIKEKFKDTYLRRDVIQNILTTLTSSDFSKTNIPSLVDSIFESDFLNSAINLEIQKMKKQMIADFSKNIYSDYIGGKTSENPEPSAQAASQAGEAAAQTGEKAAQAGKKAKQAEEEAAEGARQAGQAAEQAQGQMEGLATAQEHAAQAGSSGASSAEASASAHEAAGTAAEGQAQSEEHLAEAEEHRASAEQAAASASAAASAEGVAQAEAEAQAQQAAGKAAQQAGEQTAQGQAKAREAISNNNQMVQDFMALMGNLNAESVKAFNSQYGKFKIGNTKEEMDNLISYLSLCREVINDISTSGENFATHLLGGDPDAQNEQLNKMVGILQRLGYVFGYLTDTEFGRGIQLVPFDSNNAITDAEKLYSLLLGIEQVESSIGGGSGRGRGRTGSSTSGGGGGTKPPSGGSGDGSGSSPSGSGGSSSGGDDTTIQDQQTNAVLRRNQAIQAFNKNYVQYMRLMAKGIMLDKQGLSLSYKDQEKTKNLQRIIGYTKEYIDTQKGALKKVETNEDGTVPLNEQINENSVKETKRLAVQQINDIRTLYSNMSAEMGDNSTLVGQYWERFTGLDLNIQGMAEKVGYLKEQIVSLNEAFMSGKTSEASYKKQMNALIQPYEKDLSAVMNGATPDDVKARIKQNLLMTAKARGYSIQQGDINFTGGKNTRGSVKLTDKKGQTQILSQQFDSQSEALKNVESAYTKTQSASDKFFKSLKSHAMNLTTYAATFLSFYKVIDIFKMAINQIEEFDSALTEMRKVSDESIDRLKNFQQESFNLAEQIGTTAQQIQESTADFLRLGQDFQTAKESAKNANILFNVSEFSSIDDATTSLIAMTQAYKEVSQTHIIDSLNKVGKNIA